VTQTSGYVSPSPSGGTRNSGIRPVTVQKTSSKSKETGFKQLGKDILSGAASVKRNVDLYIDEATGSAAIQRAIDDKDSSIANRVGQGLLGLGTGIINTTGINFHKNHAANLLNVCDKCHDDFHNDEKNEKRYKKVKSTKGTIVKEI
jgi:hypothetical protein